MNFFYDLPDEIQEKIYHEAHKINSKDLFKEIKTIDFWNRDDTCYAILEMTKLLYKLDATQEERGDYYYCLDWIDGKRLNITMEDIFENGCKVNIEKNLMRVLEPEFVFLVDGKKINGSKEETNFHKINEIFNQAAIKKFEQFSL